MATNPEGKGGFTKGKSGNPTGRPKNDPEVKELARENSTEAIERLVFWMRTDEPRASVAAANAILDRAWGKPAQALEHSGSLVVNVNLSTKIK